MKMRKIVLGVLKSMVFFYNFVFGQTDQSIVYERYRTTNAVALGTTDVGVRSNIDCGVKCSHLETCHFFYYLAALNMCRLVLSTSVGATNVEVGEYDFYLANGGTNSTNLPFFVCPVTIGGQVSVFSQDAMPITFKIYTEAVQQPEAFQACASLGETLMKIQTRKKQELVSLVLTTCQVFSSHQYWLDGRADISNIWLYDDGSSVPMDQTYLWNVGAPNYPLNNNCVRMIGLAYNFRWDDNPCTYTYGYICEPI